MTVTLDPPLRHAYHAGTVRVRANVAVATHGETVEQVLGSGDGRRAFASFALRRPPLTYVRSTTNATGAVPALEVRVEDVEWTRVDSLFDAGPRDRVYVVRQAESGQTTVTFGDGVHGSRLPTGAENVRATYRVGIGEDGAAEPDQVRLPVRKPRGIAAVTNLGPAHDWAPPETLEEARLTAPQRVRTLDRAVSVTDHEDFARGYSGIGRARADLVWDGRVDTVVVSVLASTGEHAERLARHRPAQRRSTTPARPGPRGSSCRPRSSTSEPACASRSTRTTRCRSCGPPSRPPSSTPSARWSSRRPSPRRPCSSSRPRCPGVVAVTMPVLTGGADDDLLVAEPGRWGPPHGSPSAPPRLLPAQALRLSGRPARRGGGDMTTSPCPPGRPHGIPRGAAASPRDRARRRDRRAAARAARGGGRRAGRRRGRRAAPLRLVVRRDLPRVGRALPRRPRRARRPARRPRRGHRGRRQPAGRRGQHRRLPPAQGHGRGHRAGRARRHRLAHPGRRVLPPARRDDPRQPRAPRAPRARLGARRRLGRAGVARGSPVAR